MNAEQLVKGRLGKGLEQQDAAARLGVSQPYLSLLESGKRKLTPRLAAKAVKVFGLPLSSLPFTENWQNQSKMTNDELVTALAALGYPGYSHRAPKRTKPQNPAQVLLSALTNERLDARVAGALPWLVFKYPRLDWEKLSRFARMFDVQNVLGFVSSLAAELAKKKGDFETARFLAEKHTELAKSRLLAETAFPRGNMTKAELGYLKRHRSKEAKYWRVLSDVSVESLTKL